MFISVGAETISRDQHPTAATMGYLVMLLASAYAVGKAAAGVIESFDYIIVGAGTSGLVVANRLSEDPTVTVAVIEPGSDQRDNVNVTSTTAFGNAFGTAIDWAYSTTKQHDAGDKALPLHAGKAWGGTSTINGEQVVLEQSQSASSLTKPV